MNFQRFWSKPKQSRSAISNQSAVQPPLEHQELSNTRLTALNKNISKKSREVHHLPNSVKKTDHDRGSQSRIKNWVSDNVDEIKLQFLVPDS